jgi:hypothetical protein
MQNRSIKAISLTVIAALIPSLVVLLTGSALSGEDWGSLLISGVTFLTALASGIFVRSTLSVSYFLWLATYAATLLVMMVLISLFGVSSEARFFMADSLKSSGVAIALAAGITHSLKVRSKQSDSTNPTS